MGARYSRQTGYTVTRRATRVPVRTTQRRMKVGPTTAKFFGLVAVAILAIVMISQSSGQATNVYEQNGVQKQIGAVEQDIERLKLEAKRAQSIQAIQQTSVKDQMEATGSAEFVETGDVAGVATEAPAAP